MGSEGILSPDGRGMVGVLLKPSRQRPSETICTGIAGSIPSRDRLCQKQAGRSRSESAVSAIVSGSVRRLTSRVWGLLRRYWLTGPNSFCTSCYAPASYVRWKPFAIARSVAKSSGDRENRPVSNPTDPASASVWGLPSAQTVSTFASASRSASEESGFASASRLAAEEWVCAWA